MTPIKEGKYTQFSQREDGIFLIEVTVPSPDAANEMVKYFEHLAVETVPLHRIMIDVSKIGNTQSLSYSFSKMREVMQRYPQRPKGWIAVIQKSSAMMSLINTLMGIMTRRGEKFRLFPETEYDEAIAWLLQDD